MRTLWPVVMLLIGIGLGLVGARWLWHPQAESRAEHEGEHGEHAAKESEHEAAPGEVELEDAAVAKLGIATAKIVAGSAVPALRVPGRLVPDPSFAAAVRAPLAGRLLAAPEPMPRVGASVAADAVFAKLLPRLSAVERADFAQRRAQALTERDAATQAADIAGRELERVRGLHEDGNAASLHAVELAQMELAAQRGRIATAQAVLASLPEHGPGELTLSIPRAGVVDAVLAHVGEDVEAGAVLLQIDDPTHLLARVEVPAPAAVAPALQGAHVELFGEPPVVVPAEPVGWVEATAANRVLLLSPAPLPAGARAGLPLIAHLPESGAAVEGVLLPESAIVRRSDGAWVYVRKEGKGDKTTFVRLPVQLVAPQGDGWLAPAREHGPEAGADLVIHGAAALLSVERQNGAKGG